MAASVVHVSDVTTQYDQVVRLHGVTWADYERLLEIRGESAVPRYTYLEGELEIVSPSKRHESAKSMIGCLVEVWCLHHGVEFTTLGSWTLKDEDAERGLEPDECYVFGTAPNGSARDTDRPDLAIEVVWTSGGINKLEVYRKLNVAEVWYWSGGRIQPYELHDQQYRPIESSQVLPGIDLRQLERFLDHPTTSAAIREYRAELENELQE